MSGSAFLRWTRLWPGADGGLYVAVEDPEVGRTIIGAYDQLGTLRPGWPLATVDCELRPVDDGSLRIVCGDRATAFDAAGRPLSGWPVTLGHAGDVRVVGDELRVTSGTELTTVAPDGGVTVTARATPAPSPRPSPTDEDCATYGSTAADGTQFVVTRCITGPNEQTIDVFDPEGRRAGAGWPVSIPAGVSEPVAGPDGRVYVVAAGWGSDSSRILAFQPDGRPVARWSVELPGAPPHVGSWADPYIPLPPLVAPDGTVWFVTERTAYAVDPTGHVRPGWPYRSTVDLGYVGYCGPCDIDCFPGPSTPLLGPDGVLYLIQSASSKAIGGQVTAIGPDGKVRAGWPVVLSRPGAEFWSVVAGSDGMVYALAIEPEGPAEPPKGACAPPASATIIAIGPDGQVRYRVTVVEP